MIPRPNIEGWVGVLCWGIAFHAGWRLLDLVCDLVIWIAGRIAH